MTLHETLTHGFAKALGTDANSEIDAYVHQGRGPLPGTARLLAWDANSIHGFVFSTTNATAIRGASHVLRELDAALLKGRILGLHPDQILFAGGGSGLAVVADADAERVRRRLHELYAERTVIATCTAADVALAEGDQGFDERKAFLDLELSRLRVLTGPDAEPAVPFFAQRCEVCGRRAAAVHQKRHHGLRYECEPCRRFVDTGRDTRHSEAEPVDFQDVSDRSSGGFYAVIYADGNGIGKIISTLKSPLEYKSFSLALSDVFEGAFESVRKSYALNEEGTRLEPGYGYQLPICAGDDLVVILPGAIAVPFARELLREIERLANDQKGLPSVGAAAGVAIGQVKFPVRHLLTEAETLLKKSAKERVYRDGVRSVIDFSLLEDGSPRREGQPKEDKFAFRQTGKPYTLDEIDTFSKRFEKVRAAAIGKSQLYILRDHAARGLPQLRNHVLYQVGRRDAWRQLVTELAGADVVGDKEACMNQIVPRYGGRPTFDVADMIELYGHWGRENA